MARPQPDILLQGMKGRTATEITVVAADSYWIVTLDNRPVNVYTINLGQYNSSKKYTRTGGSNRAAIRNAAERLNQYFKTDRFGCQEVTIKGE